MSLVPLPRSYLSSLSIGTLKAVLYENHVRVDFSQVLEKSELVGRVAELVEDERKRLERQRREEEREEREAREAKERAERAERGEMSPGPSNGARGTDGDLIDLMDGAELGAGEDAAAGEEGEGVKSDSGSEPKGARSPRSPPTGPQAEDRGLCVVCQDEEATLAVVDCGHLAMCARKYPQLYRLAQLADIRLLRPRHGHYEGVPYVSYEDRHAAETDQDLPCVNASTRSVRACRGPLIGVQKFRSGREEGRDSCTYRQRYTITQGTFHSTTDAHSLHIGLFMVIHGRLCSFHVSVSVRGRSLCSPAAHHGRSRASIVSGLCTGIPPSNPGTLPLLLGSPGMRFGDTRCPLLGMPGTALAGALMSSSWVHFSLPLFGSTNPPSPFSPTRIGRSPPTRPPGPIAPGPIVPGVSVRALLGCMPGGAAVPGLAMVTYGGCVGDRAGDWSSVKSVRIASLRGGW